MARNPEQRISVIRTMRAAVVAGALVFSPGIPSVHSSDVKPDFSSRINSLEIAASVENPITITGMRKLPVLPSELGLKADEDVESAFFKKDYLDYIPDAPIRKPELVSAGERGRSVAENQVRTTQISGDKGEKAIINLGGDAKVVFEEGCGRAVIVEKGYSASTDTQGEPITLVDSGGRDDTFVPVSQGGVRARSITVEKASSPAIVTVYEAPDRKIHQGTIGKPEFIVLIDRSTEGYAIKRLNRVTGKYDTIMTNIQEEQPQESSQNP